MDGVNLAMWAPGDTVDRFKLERIIGQGGFGMTYLAKDTSLNPPVNCVIKTLRTDLKDFEVQQTKFRQEALNLARCSHPHVVAVRDVIKEDGIWALVMDYVDGDNLATVIRDNPAERLPEADALRYIDQIGQALECVHDRGLLHRDVKPLNIMIRRDTGNAILIDFGLARDFTLDSSRSMTAMMTEGFAPIEQYDRRGVFGPYTDVYALAATLYCMLTGEAPLFNAKGRKEAKDEGKSIDDFMWNKLKAAGVSSQVLRAIMWGMEVLTIDRPQSVRELREALGLSVQSVPQQIPVVEPRSEKLFEIPPITGGSTVQKQSESPYSEIKEKSNKFGRPNWSFVFKWSAASFLGGTIVFLFLHHDSPLRPLSYFLSQDIFMYIPFLAFLGMCIGFLQWLILKRELSSRIWFANNSLSLIASFWLLFSLAWRFGNTSSSHWDFYFDNDVKSAYILWSFGAATFLAGTWTFLMQKLYKSWWYIFIPIATALLGNIVDFTLYSLFANKLFLFVPAGLFLFSLLSVWIYKPSILKKNNTKKYVVYAFAIFIFLLLETSFKYEFIYYYDRYSNSIGSRSSHASPLIASLTIISSCISSGLVMDWLVRTQRKSIAN